MARRIFFSFILVMLVIGLFINPAPASAEKTAVEVTRDTLYVPGEVLVVFTEDVKASQMLGKANALAEIVSATVVETAGSTVLLSMDETADVVAAVNQLSTASGVKYAQPNYIYWIPEENPLGEMVLRDEVTFKSADVNAKDGEKLTRKVSDLAKLRSMRTVNGKTQGVPTYTNDQWNNWGFNFVGAPIIWPNTAPSPMVCVLDTGVDGAHPDLSSKVFYGWDFVNNDSIPNDDHGHGTHLAGVIAAKYNTTYIAGISNGWVLAVKVLSAQGWGTTLDIANGIRYCANQTRVKVINMSLGGAPGDQMEYDALEYAIVNKNKLVVAAAGNDGMSYYDFPLDSPDLGLVPASYPAGWAAAWVPQPNGKSNTIAHGLMSVAAVQDDGPTWVDTNGDGIKDDNESFSYCATHFSNYGDWVEIAAPGENIYSTLPVSYPFYENWYGGSSSGADSWSGTSMATPHVAAAAARAWSIYPTMTAAQIEDHLIATGDSISGYAVDPNTDPNFINSGYYDDHVDGKNYQGDAPYCWPDATAPYTSMQSMEDTVMLNVASAMDRAAVYIWHLEDATTGLPIKDVTASIVTSTGLTKDTGRTSYGWIEFINLPIHTTPGGSVAYVYKVTVNKSGYTAGSQTVTKWHSLPFAGTYFALGADSGIALAPFKDFQIVTNWINSGYDFDMNVWLPSGAPSSPFIVGYWEGAGPGGEGALGYFPFARRRIDGSGDLPFESVTIQKSTAGNYPYYPGNYQVLLHDYGAENYGYAEFDVQLVVRIWQTGVLKLSVYNFGSCSPGEYWWHAATIAKNGTSTSFTPVDTCGTGSTGGGGVWPYSYSNSTQTIFNKP